MWVSLKWGVSGLWLFDSCFAFHLYHIGFEGDEAWFGIFDKTPFRNHEVVDDWIKWHMHWRWERKASRADSILLYILIESCRVKITKTFNRPYQKISH